MAVDCQICPTNQQSKVTIRRGPEIRSLQFGTSCREAGLDGALPLPVWLVIFWTKVTTDSEPVSFSSAVDPASLTNLFSASIGGTRAPRFCVPLVRGIAV